jgi:methylmalonyl-CoA epimerase
VDHVGIAVYSAEAALDWYRDVLGLPLLHDEWLPHLAVRLVYLGRGQDGAAMVQLVEPLGEGPVARFLAEQGEGLHHVCFAVADIPALLATLPGEEETAEHLVMGGRGRRACFLQGRPGGVHVELTETRVWSPGTDRG